jgi:Tfp pilus assembly protein PilO
MGRFCKEYKVCVILLVSFLLGCSLFFFYIYLPQKDAIHTKHRQLQEQQTKLAEINDFLKTYGDSGKYKQETEKLYLRASTRLPDKMEQGNFLTILQEKALLQNIQLSSILPGTIEAYGTYFSLPIQISFHCTYFQLLDFLQSLEEAERFFVVQGVNVHAASQELECMIHLLVYSSED